VAGDFLSAGGIEERGGLSWSWGQASDCYLDLKLWMRELSKGAQAGVPVPLKATAESTAKAGDSFVTLDSYLLLKK
jgi:hypothetical protein